MTQAEQPLDAIRPVLFIDCRTRSRRNPPPATALQRKDTPMTATRHPGSLPREPGLDKAQFLALVTRTAALKGARYGLDGAEVTDGVPESQRPVVIDQAGNRRHTIKAVLVTALAR
jgi:ornithine carbamoyltransferase